MSRYHHRFAIHYRGELLHSAETREEAEKICEEFKVNSAAMKDRFSNRFAVPDLDESDLKIVDTEGAVPVDGPPPGFVVDEDGVFVPAT